MKLLKASILHFWLGVASSHLGDGGGSLVSVAGELSDDGVKLRALLLWRQSAAAALRVRGSGQMVADHWCASKRRLETYLGWWHHVESEKDRRSAGRKFTLLQHGLEQEQSRSNELAREVEALEEARVWQMVQARMVEACHVWLQTGLFMLTAAYLYENATPVKRTPSSRSRSLDRALHSRTGPASDMAGAGDTPLEPIIVYRGLSTLGSANSTLSSSRGSRGSPQLHWSPDSDVSPKEDQVMQYTYL